jgi:hypothetical protein
LKKPEKKKGYIPVYLIINKRKFIQHLVKYNGKWCLYLNAPMRKAADKDYFNSLPTSRQNEILRYLNNLKTEASLNKNILRAINFLVGKENFIGRNKPM